MSSQTPSLHICESSQSVSVEQAGESSLQATSVTAARQSAIKLALKLDIDIYQSFVLDAFGEFSLELWARNITQSVSRMEWSS